MPSRQRQLGSGDAGLSSPSGSGSSSSKSSSSRVVVAAGIAGGAAALLLLLLLLLLVYQRLKASKTNPYDLAGLKQLRRFSYRQLKTATAGFSDTQRLGQGGFGTVYRGQLRHGQAVAVKKLDASSLQGEREFQNEVSVIGRVASPHVVTLLGFCVDGNRRLLVYDFMPNRSLQEALFDDDYPVTLAWETRFKVILDTAQGLAFLHFQCDPPIIHGDVKPSNILLDADFCARIADFGLARLKLEPAVPDAASQELQREALERERMRFERAAREKVRRLRKREEAERARLAAAAAASAAAAATAAAAAPAVVQDEQQEAEGEVEGEVSAAATPLTPASGAGAIGIAAMQQQAEGTPVSAATPVADSPLTLHLQLEGEGGDTRTEADTETVDFSTEDGRGEDEAVPSRRARVEVKSEGVPSSGELSIRDYILEWRSNESARRAARGARDDNSVDLNSHEFGKGVDRDRRRDGSRSSDGWVDLSGELIQEPLKRKEVGRREGREWWKDEHLEGSSKGKDKDKDKSGRDKGKARKHRREWWKDEYSGQLRSSSGGAGDGAKGKAGARVPREWWNKEDFSSAEHGAGKEKEKKSSRRRGGSRDRDKDREDASSEVSYSAELRSNNSSRRTRTRARTRSRDCFSGDLSRGVSSTPSMRGTICYVAPEYGGGGVLSEKSDVYSFGVLMLVIISGRRPLQVMASPIAELERANLISWARHLAQAGNVLDLVDANFQGHFSKDQATLCIMLALLCLQRIPALRPTMPDVVKILLGQADLPALPFEFSPSPPGLPLAAFTSRSSEVVDLDLPLLS